MKNKSVGLTLHGDQLDRLNGVKDQNRAEALRRIIDAGLAQLGLGEAPPDRLEIQRGRRATSEPYKTVAVSIPMTWVKILNQAVKDGMGTTRADVIRGLLGPEVLKLKGTSKGRGKTDAEILEEATNLVRRTKRCTITTLRTLGIGAARARRIQAQLIERGVLRLGNETLVVMPDGVKLRKGA